MIILLLGILSPAHALDEVISFGVDEHDSTCSGNDDLDFAIAQAGAFDDVFDGWITSGYWDESIQRGDASVDEEDFTDSTQYSAPWGADDVDNVGSDYADVAYLSTHGVSECESGHWSRVVMGQDTVSSDGRCRTYTNTHTNNTPSTREMEYGNQTNGDAEVLILDACQSVHKCVWENAGYNGMDGTNFEALIGFHGDSFDRSDQVAAVEDYASTSRTSGLGDHWLDERVVWNIFANLDQCPTVVIWGSSSANRDDLFDNGGLDDRFDAGSNTANTFYFLNNCDPDNGEVL